MTGGESHPKTRTERNDPRWGVLGGAKYKPLILYKRDLFRRMVPRTIMPHAVYTKEFFPELIWMHLSWLPCCCSYPIPEALEGVETRKNSWLERMGDSIQIVSIETKDFEYDNFVRRDARTVIHYERVE